MPNPLPFSMQVQEQTEWCWAATAASVSAYYDVAPVLTQCEVASKCIGVDCCITPLPPERNIKWALDAALKAIKHLAADPSGALPFSSIVTEIDGGRPICCHISWDHFIAIVGYDDSNQDVVVCDPDPHHAEQTLPYETFVSDYYEGSWDYSYLTK